MSLRTILLAQVMLLTATLGGCAKSPRLAGQPQPVFLPKETQNPDVLWIVREVVTDRKDLGTVPLWGLYACYRSAEPSAPQCFLAQTAGTKEQLVWPDDATKYRW